MGLNAALKKKVGCRREETEFEDGKKWYRCPGSRRR